MVGCKLLQLDPLGSAMGFIIAVRKNEISINVENTWAHETHALITYLGLGCAKQVSGSS